MVDPKERIQVDPREYGKEAGDICHTAWWEDLIANENIWEPAVADAKAQVAEVWMWLGIEDSITHAALGIQENPNLCQYLPQEGTLRDLLKKQEMVPKESQNFEEGYLQIPKCCSAEQVTGNRQNILDHGCFVSPFR